MKYVIYAFVLLLLLSYSFMQAEVRTWTNATGEFSVKAELLSVSEDGKSVKLRRIDSKKEITLELEKLSLEDRKFVSEYKKPNDAPEKKQAAPKVAKDKVDLNPTNQEMQYELGMRYMTGDGVPKNETKAVEWFQQAARRNNIPAQFELSKAYLEGIGTEKNAKEGDKLLRILLEKEYADALYYEGIRLANTTDRMHEFEEMRAEGFFLLRKAEIQGHADAIKFFSANKPTKEVVEKMCYQARNILEPTGLNDDLRHKRAPKKNEIGNALIYLHLAASYASPEAQYRLATFYMLGNHVPKDHKKAMQLLNAAEINCRQTNPLGDVKALTLLGNICIQKACLLELRGEKGKADYNELIADARQWLERAAPEEPDALFKLGYLNANNIGSNGKIAEGLRMIKKAAELGSREAKNLLKSL